MKSYKKDEIYNSESIENLKKNYTKILNQIGEDPNREGLIKTPERVAKLCSF